MPTLNEVGARARAEDDKFKNTVIGRFDALANTIGILRADLKAVERERDKLKDTVTFLTMERNKIRSTVSELERRLTVLLGRAEERNHE